MTLQKNDFIEIEFTGKTQDGEIFDSNIKEDIEKTKMQVKAEPFVFCLGQGMFLKGIDDFLIGKKIGEYEIELTPEQAFGKRDPQLVKIIPIKLFHQQKVNPIPGATFNFDGKIARIISVSGGRVMTDFNNPIAGKHVFYKIKIKRKLEDQNEKIKAFVNFLFKQDLKFEIKGKKIILELKEPMLKFAEMFKDKFNEIFNLDLEIKNKENKSKA